MLNDEQRYDPSKHALLFAPQVRWIQFGIAEDAFLRENFQFDKRLTYAYIEQEVNKKDS